MVTCPSCRGTIADDGATCIYCGNTLNKRGWWRRVLDAFSGDQSLEHSNAGIQLQEQGRLVQAIKSG